MDIKLKEQFLKNWKKYFGDAELPATFYYSNDDGDSEYAGCGSIIHYPYLEKDSEKPRAVIGMFDPSARHCVPADPLTFAVPIVIFNKMINYMKESFLITQTWTKIIKRIT